MRKNYTPHPKPKKKFIKVDKEKRLRVISQKRFTAMTEDYFTLDSSLFHNILEIYMQACNGNYTQAARFIGVTRLTLIRWRDQDYTPPAHQWYHVDNLVKATRLVLLEWRKASSRELLSKASDMSDRLSKLIRDYKLADDQDLKQLEGSDPKTYLLSLFRETHMISTTQLRQEGRFSMRVLRLAARELHLQQSTSGFGAEKETVYELPEDED